MGGRSTSDNSPRPQLCGTLAKKSIPARDHNQGQGAFQARHRPSFGARALFNCPGIPRFFALHDMTTLTLTISLNC
jgi:hypothetical protein